MDLKVQRVFIILIIIFSIVFGILSVFFRSTNILGFPGEYWAGIFCVGVILLILGLVVLVNFQVMEGIANQNYEKVSPLAYAAIFISIIGLVIPVFPFLAPEFICSSEYSSSFTPIIFLPIVCGLLSVLFGAISLFKSRKMLSIRSQRWSIFGLLLGILCLISLPCSFIVLILTDICE